MTTRRELLRTGAVAAAGTAGWAGAAVRSAPVQAASPRQYRAAYRRIKIPMRDGIELTALMAFPEDAAPGEKFPALFHTDPYRGAERASNPTYTYYAEHGYHAVYLDVRGTGASAGQTTPNQYSEQEVADSLDAIAWLAAQPWCNGNVGMFGASYGGFNSIQIAMRNPPALKAIIPIFATDDVYTDDIAYYDGALQCESLGRWPFSMIASMGLPAAPDHDVDTAEARYRVEHEPWIFEMLRHQTNDAFWRRQSLRPDYARLKIPTLHVGGWLDAYTDSIPRMLEQCPAPQRAIMGPWTHAVGLPGPAIHILREHVRWWDHWLKGIDTGLMREPKFVIYVNHSYRASLTIPEIPGEWRYESGWPVARARMETWYPQPGARLARERGAAFRRDLEYRPTAGITNRYRCPHNSAELPIDQRPDDLYAMCFDTDPLDADLEILGFPEVDLQVSHSARTAHWVVRLCDVAPDGSSTLVTKGILNGTQHASNATPAPLEPGKIYRMQCDLKAISWVFPKGHRVRIAIGNADFPNLWPTPYKMTTTLHMAEGRVSRIGLPVVPAGPAPAVRPTFGPPDILPGRGPGAPRNKWTITRDEMAKSVTVFRETLNPPARPGEPTGFERRWVSVSDDDPARTTIVAEGQAQARRPDGAMLTCKTAMRIASDEAAFTISVKRELFVGDQVKYSKTWDDRIARTLT